MPRKIIKTKYEFEDEIFETLAEVAEEKYKPLPANDKLKYVGKEIPRLDRYDKVSGSATYTFDVILPHMAHAKILRSHHPHANIKSIDTSKAEKLDGVLYIITHKNIPKIEWYYGTTELFDTHLRYVGDEIACVAAVDEKTAEKALGLIEVEYEILPFVVDAEEALENNAPKIYGNGNLCSEDKYERGDIEKGFQEADFIVEDTFKTQVAVHNPTESFCSVVNWDGDKLTVYDSTQGVYEVRDTVANSLNIDNNDVRVHTKYMGGGFGAKLETGKYTVMAALLAKKIGRPVRIALDRKEMNLCVGNRPDSVQKLKFGAKKDGTLTAMSHDSYGVVGAHPSRSNCSGPLVGLYNCPNVKAIDKSIYVNLGRARPFRAPGYPQGTFGMDSLMDELAEKIGMDPLDFRIKNCGDFDPVSGNPYSDKKLLDAYKLGAEAFKWYERRKPAGSDKGIIKKGLGLATQIWGGGGHPPAGATLKLDSDGSLTIIAGSQDLGTGTYTFIAQVAAEILELPIEKINVILGDTGVGPYNGSSGGSTTAASVSPAVRDGAEKMKEKLVSAASAILEIPIEELTYKDGVVSGREKNIAIKEIMNKMRERTLFTEGAREANPPKRSIRTFGVQFAEVDVNTSTGKINVIKILAAHDIGRVLNKKTLKNQFYGGILQGLGLALMEDRVVDRNTGKVLTTDLHNYKMPTSADIPEIELIMVSEGDEVANNMGVKGIGEPAIIPTAAAVANAVYNAIGIRIKSMPMTPDKILNALYAKS